MIRSGERRSINISGTKIVVQIVGPRVGKEGKNLKGDQSRDCSNCDTYHK